MRRRRLSSEQPRAQRGAQAPSLRARLAEELRDPRVRADLRRQARLLASHPENDAIDEWIENNYDFSEWR